MTRLQLLTGLLLRACFWPTFDDEERTRRARTFHGITLSTMFVIAVFLLLLVLAQPGSFARRSNSIAMVLGWCFALLWVNFKGFTRSASWLLVLGMLTLVTARAYTAGGVTAPTLSLFVYISMVGGTLLGTWGGLVVSLGLAVSGLWLALLEVAGRLPPAQLIFTPVTTWLYSCMALSMSVLLHPQITRALADSLARAQAEILARRTAERRLRIALDAGGIGVWDLDPGTGRFTADQRLFELYRLAPGPDGTISTATWFERVHSDDKAKLKTNLVGLTTGSISADQYEFRAVLPGGELRYVYGAGSAVKDEQGNVVRIVGVNRDITESKQADAERARLVHELGERVKELGLLHTAARMLHYDRPSNEALFQELVEHIPLAWRYPECCEARIAYRDIDVVTVGFRDSAWRLSRTFTTSEGTGVVEVVFLEQRSHVVEDPFLAEERVLLASLADMLVSYLELRRHRERLEQLVAIRTREMQDARDEAERASRAKTTFLATMSHEIRTPMNAILGYAQLLRRDAKLGGAQRQQVESILSSGDHLLTLINDILEMSKIEAGREVLNVEPVDLHKLLLGIEQMFTALARNKSLNLAFEIPSDLPRLVEVDPRKVRQVLINLLSNAVKFTWGGGVTLRATVAERTALGYLLQIAVTDTGRGVAEADIQRIFETFEQADAGAHGVGTGLGLSIARRLAQLMGGDVTATSGVGVGSTFVFTFQASLPSAETAARLERGNVLRLASGQRIHKVLVVDDVPENVAVATSLLGAVGYDVQGTHSAEAGLILHDEWRPDLVLMDLRMPGLGGLEAIKLLCESGSNAVLVAFTASGFDDLIEAAREAGARDVILKPYRETEFLETIARLLELELTYEQSGHSVPPASSHRSVTELASLFEKVPISLRERLREAVLQARVQRVELLADEVSSHSVEAAQQLRELVRDFSFDEISEALRPV